MKEETPESHPVCVCDTAQGSKGSNYSGKYCDCCDGGECKKVCDPRIKDGDDGEPCFGRGNCDCKPKCKVLLPSLASRIDYQMGFIYGIVTSPINQTCEFLVHGRI